MKEYNITLPKIYRCKYCRCILGDYMRGKLYCSDWCRELGEDQQIKYHKCKYCDNGTSPFINKNGNKAGTYRKICDECFESKSYILKTKEKKTAKRREDYKKRVIDMNGHTCKKCGVYKTLDMFDKNNTNKKGISYRCKQCCAVTHKMYVHRNREKINLYSKLKQQEYKLKKLNLCQT